MGAGTHILSCECTPPRAEPCSPECWKHCQAGHRQAPPPSLTMLFVRAPDPAIHGGPAAPPSALGAKSHRPTSSGKEFLALQVCCFFKGSPGLVPAPDARLSAHNTDLDRPPSKIQKGRHAPRSVQGRVSTHPGLQCSSRRPQEADWPGRRVMALPGPDGALRGGGCSAAGS